MGSPLTPATESSLNIMTPPAAHRFDEYEMEFASSVQPQDASLENPHHSSPLLSTASETPAVDQENTSPTKSRHSRVLSGAALSPLKILADQREQTHEKPSGPLRSPRKVSPDRRFPVKVSNPIELTRPSHERTMSLQDAVRQNEGLKRAIEIFEDEQSVLETESTEPENENDVSSGTVHIHPTAPMELDESVCPDDSMISTFSTFSAVPNMTMLAKLGQSPSKATVNGSFTPRARTGPSPTRRQEDSASSTNLLDFTEQLRHPQRVTPSKRGLSPSRSGPVTATPSRGFSNLIDFDIPPMPTPRSVPTITPRELESLKSNFLSEISSLKASLSGKEAEVHSLKAAVGDAEKRVGESMEKLREESALREQLADEKQGWENRGRELETVLRQVKDDVITSQQEREELEQKLEESEKRREAAEMMHQEAESKMAGMRAGKDCSPEKPKNPEAANREVEMAVERVARELHGLYKSKHETKVAALKKSYESRWEKKVLELENQIKELHEDNDKLRVDHDTTMTRIDMGNTAAEERKAQAVRDNTAIRELNAEIQRLEATVETVKKDNENLRGMLEQERVEKGELVQLAEEMMSMQSFVGPSSQKQQPKQQAPALAPMQQTQQPQRLRSPERPESKTPKRSMEQFRGSVGPVRGSGLRAPGSGLRAPHERTKSAGLPRPGGGGRSGIMNSIERMGSHRGRGGE